MLQQALMQYKIFSSVICISLLLYSSYTDIKRKEIPIILYFIFTAITFGVHFYFKHNMLPYLLGLAAMVILFFIQAIFSGGGGDIIMMAFIGLSNGLFFSLITTIIAFAATIPFFIYKKIQHKDLREEYPFAPFACIGYTCTLIAMTLIGA